MYSQIHDIIVKDNIRSRIKPSSSVPVASNVSYSQDASHQSQQLSLRPASFPGTADYGDDDDSSMRITNGANGNDARNGDPPSHVSRERPKVQPKPASLHAAAHKSTNNSNEASSSTDILAERFAQLRRSQNAPHSHLPYPITGSSVEFPSPQRHSTSSSTESSFALSEPQSPRTYQNTKPSGPRVMPPAPAQPPLPPKLPLDTRIAPSLPRAPSPTYSPARNSQTPPNMPPSRRLVKATTTHNESFSYIPSSTLTYTTTYAPDTSDSASVSKLNVQSRFNAPPRPQFRELPNATAISAQELYDRVRQYDILLIDVRNREEYDNGHILAKSIMCIEPLSLKSGFSAEDLEDRLVVSPESEELCFQRREEYDLIVYYDQMTSSNRFLEGPPKSSSAPALRALHECLYEFNYYKKLRRPPAVLLGGLEAWIDLVGPQALQVTRTVALLGTARARKPPVGTGWPISRVPMATSNSSREIQRRRLRDYDPLDADEERKWLEKAKEEEVEPAEYQAQSDGDTDSVSSHPDEAVSPLVHSYEDFLRRFPEPSNLQQSMIGLRQGPPARLPPPPPMPSMPSRPPPAAPRPSYSGVSERDITQLSPTSRQPSNAQLPLYTSRSMPQYLKLPRTGLINFSVTCYMNATIQCLLATIPLSQFFLDNRWRSFTQKNWKGSNGIMPEIYANLIRSLWRNDVQAVRPTSLRNFCTRLNREWGIDRQQDAKEFLEFLVDCLHEDLNVNWERQPLRPLTPEEELVRERMSVVQVSRTEWDRYSHREQSFISTLFAGQHASRLRCTTCGNTSTTYEAFYSISVEIPRTGCGDIRECLRSYCQEEMLSGDEVWKCPHCKCEREATKRITLTRLPQVLVVHFKRFSASKTESARKVHTPIDFPLHGLNMEPYMAPTQAYLKDVGEGVPDPAITPPFQFDAYAVMRHLGQTGNGGHYVALVRDQARGCWRKFDDERAKDFDPSKLRLEQRLQNEQAYIVFYGRSAAR